MLKKHPLNEQISGLIYFSFCLEIIWGIVKGQPLIRVKFPSLPGHLLVGSGLGGKLF